MVLFKVQWLGRKQRGTTTFQERYSKSFVWDLLLNPCTGIGGLVYALAMQYSSILYVLFEIKVVKCKLCESTLRFGGMKMLPRALCSSTHVAFVVIRLWTSWALMMILVYLRMEQSPDSCFLWGCAMLFR